MPRVRALTSWADRRAGDEFEATEADARLLCATDGIGGQRAELVDRALEADKGKKTEPEAPAPDKQTDKRRYLRRDLRAQS